MAELNESDRRQMQALAAEALVGDEPEATAATRTAVDAGDVKEFFCKNWPMIKKVLKFIADKVGGVVAAFVRAIIAAGDFLHGRICG